MKENKLVIIDKLIKENKIDEAQFELSKMGTEFHKNANYLYLRSKVFYINKLYYLAIDTLLIALEFEQNDKIYNMIAEIYNILENRELSKSIYNANQREAAIKLLKNELSGMYYKK